MIYIKGIASEEKEICVYDPDFTKNATKVKVWYRNKKKCIDIEDFHLWNRYVYDIKTPVILIRKENYKQSLNDFYNEIIQTANELKEATNGKINMYVTGRYSKTAVHFYFTEYFNKMNLSIESISYKEAQWIQLATSGSLMIAKEYTGPAWSYDFCSFYPSIMRHNKMLFPIKAGEFKTITKEDFDNLEFYQYGIYKAKIIKSDDKNINKLFRFNKNNFYTHIDLTSAKQLGLKTIITEEQSNFLYYKRESLVSGKRLFGDYINYLFQLKQINVAGAKILLNCLWGILCQNNLKKIRFNIEEGFELFNNNDFVNIVPINDSEMIAEVVDPEHYFEFDFARMKPFLLAKGRKILSETIQPFSKNIIYSHTDSLISNIKLNIKTGKDIGNLVYEGYCPNFWCKNIQSKSKKQEFIK